MARSRSAIGADAGARSSSIESLRATPRAAGAADAVAGGRSASPWSRGVAGSGTASSGGLTPDATRATSLSRSSRDAGAARLASRLDSAGAGGRQAGPGTGAGADAPGGARAAASGRLSASSDLAAALATDRRRASPNDLTTGDFYHVDSKRHHDDHHHGHYDHHGHHDDDWCDWGWGWGYYGYPWYGGYYGGYYGSSYWPYYSSGVYFGVSLGSPYWSSYAYDSYYPYDSFGYGYGSDTYNTYNTYNYGAQVEEPAYGSAGGGAGPTPAPEPYEGAAAPVEAPVEAPIEAPVEPAPLLPPADAGRLDSPLPAADRFPGLSLPQRLVAEGLEAFRRGDDEEASELFYNASLAAPESGVVRLVLAASLFAIGEYGYAADYLRQAWSAPEGLAGLRFDLVAFYGAERRADLALDRRALEERVTRSPDDADAALILGFVARAFEVPSPSAGASDAGISVEAAARRAFLAAPGVDTLRAVTLR